MKQFRLREAQMLLASARDSSPRTDLRNLETMYRNCSLLVRLLVSDHPGKSVVLFRVGILHRSGESFLRFAPAALHGALIVALFVGAVFGVLGQHLSSRAIDLVIDGRQFG